MMNEREMIEDLRQEVREYKRLYEIANENFDRFYMNLVDILTEHGISDPYKLLNSAI